MAATRKFDFSYKGARGWAINGHSVPEVFWDGAWHMLDASLINYFPKADGTIAGGMVPKVRAALAALNGASEAVIADGAAAGALSRALDDPASGVAETRTTRPPSRAARSAV